MIHESDTLRQLAPELSGREIEDVTWQDVADLIKWLVYIPPKWWLAGIIGAWLWW